MAAPAPHIPESWVSQVVPATWKWKEARLAWRQWEKSSLFFFATTEWCYPWSSPEHRNGNICWGKILAKNPTKKVMPSQHWVGYSLHWVLCFLFSFSEHLGFILEFWKSFLGNPTLSSIFWSGWRQVALALWSIVCWRRTQLCSPKYTLFSRYFLGNVLASTSAILLLVLFLTVMEWVTGFVSLVFVSRLFFSLHFVSMSCLFNVPVFLI